MEYTKETHIERVREILSKLSEGPIDFSNACPLFLDFGLDCSEDNYIEQITHKDDIIMACRICQNFLGVPKFHDVCPCFHYGTSEAIRLAIEKTEKGEE